MTLKKSLLTCAITVALSSSFAANANIDNKNQSSSILASQVSATATGNSVAIDQTSLQGIGNDVLVNQQGDGLNATVTINGDGNSTEIEQKQNQNLTRKFS